MPEIPTPDGHGWYFADDAELEIKWMDCNPAPDEILEVVICDCKKKCVQTSCSCMQLGFSCTDACSLVNCSNTSDDMRSRISSYESECIIFDSDCDSDVGE